MGSITNLTPTSRLHWLRAYTLCFVIPTSFDRISPFYDIGMLRIVEPSKKATERLLTAEAGSGAELRRVESTVAILPVDFSILKFFSCADSFLWASHVSVYVHGSLIIRHTSLF